MAQYFSNVQETSTTTGTGPVTLGGATTGKRAFGAVLSIADYAPYHIKASDGQWERGFTKYSAANVIDRDFVMESSNGGTAITLPAGTHTVTLPATPEMGVRRGYQLNVEGSAAWGYNVAYPLPFNGATPIRDTEGLFSGVTADLIVPAWVDRIQVDMQMRIFGSGTGTVELGIGNLESATFPYLPQDGGGNVVTADTPFLHLSGVFDVPEDSGGNKGIRVVGMHYIFGTTISPVSGSWINVEFLG